MAEGAAAAAIVGTGFQIFGQIQQSKAQRKALEDQARAKEEQALELLRRTEINIDQLEREARRFKGAQVAAAARAGVNVGGLATLVQLEQTARDLMEEEILRREEARFKSKQLLSGAGLDINLADDIRQANLFNIGGSLLGGFSKVASSSRRSTDDPTLVPSEPDER